MSTPLLPFTLGAWLAATAVAMDGDGVLTRRLAALAMRRATEDRDDLLVVVVAFRLCDLAGGLAGVDTFAGAAVARLRLLVPAPLAAAAFGFDPATVLARPLLAVRGLMARLARFGEVPPASSMVSAALAAALANDAAERRRAGVLIALALPAARERGDRGDSAALLERVR
ncbi:MAG: hypothetical protein ACK5QW_08465 [Cyanobacteriota bacterium]